MDLLDGPAMDEPDDADMIEMDPPRRPWDRHAQKWQLRWREARRVTRVAVAGGAIAVVAIGAGIGYALTRPPAGSTVASSTLTGSAASVSGPGSKQVTQVEWARGPHGKPWAVVTSGSIVGSAMSGVQVGTVTRASPSSLTVKSPGRPAASYAITAATRMLSHDGPPGAFREGETVEVIAGREGKTNVALFIEDLAAPAHDQGHPGRITVINPATGKTVPGISQP